MGFLSGLLGTGNDYQYNQNGIGFGANAAGAIQNQNAVTGQEQGLANQLQQNALGQGPNPAQAMLQRQTALNNSQGAGLIASQKGINPALAARLAAQQTAQGNQNAASQGAILGAQQQLAAQGQLGNLYGQMGQQNIAQQGLNYQGINAQNAINAGVAQGNQQTNAQIVGGVLSGAGQVGAASAKGGAAAGAANGGEAGKDFGSGKLTAFLDSMFNGGEAGASMKSGGGVPGTPKVPGNSYSNDTVKALLSPGEVVIPNNVMQSSDPVRGAASFVQSVLAKKRMKK